MGEVVALASPRTAARSTQDAAETRAVGARRFAECLSDVIERHAPTMTARERREADEAVRALLALAERVERTVQAARDAAD